MYVCEREKKNSFEIYVIILRYMRNVNLPFKRNFKFAELLTKTYFFLYLETVLKMAKETKEVSKVYEQKKHASRKVAKVEDNLS